MEWYSSHQTSTSMSGTYDMEDARAFRLAQHITNHVVESAEGMEESLNFWTDKSPRHAAYFEGRRDALEGVRNELHRGILSFFRPEQVEQLLAEYEAQQDSAG